METNIEVTLTNINPDKFVLIQSKLSKEIGLVISGDKGVETKDGFTISYNYNPIHLTVDLVCSEKPWYVPDMVVRSKLEELPNE